MFGAVFQRRLTALAVACAMSVAPALAQEMAPDAAAAGTYDLLVGTYTAGKSHGIYVYRFNAADGQVTPLSSVQTVNPSYLVVAHDYRHVYAVNELPGDNGPATEHGGISAFSFDPQAGQLTLINRVSSEGNDPCYLAFSPDGRYLLTANYSVAADPGGSFAVFPVQSDGGVAPAVLVVHHEGGGPVKGRQDNAHVHSTVFAPDGRYLFAQDLGNDKLYEYRFTNDGSRGLISPVPEGYTQMPPGSGPRHLIFDAGGRYAYLTSELTGTVTAMQYANGKLRTLQVLRLTAPGFKGKIGAGAIHLSPDGKFLYATNRGDANEIVVFSVDPYDGLLKLVGRQSTLGRTPREFAIDPTGRWLIVGNQDSDSAVVFKRDPTTGLLRNPVQLSIGSPVDFHFTPSS
ncbi:lactonase family protein [Trinickia diaoshuihuensis]|uniref:lactonase family protein n=1 Tax=Trinickia diaoshuihuensis TaxID=2292265 RepID=UPI001F086B86|nr:lactonase family protein [Trinickia diaoshuihuensis]